MTEEKVIFVPDRNPTLSEALKIVEGLTYFFDDSDYIHLHDNDVKWQENYLSKYSTTQIRNLLSFVSDVYAISHVAQASCCHSKNNGFRQRAWNSYIACVEAGILGEFDFNSETILELPRTLGKAVGISLDEYLLLEMDNLDKPTNWKEFAARFLESNGNVDLEELRLDNKNLVLEMDKL